jgi:thiamine-monophosphate kinase
MMLISQLGEFKLIERIKKSLPTDSSVIKGAGDDCAVVSFNKSKYLLLTSDMIVEGVDFTADHDPRLIGRKALALSLSDIAACGGVPRYALVSLGIKKNASLAYVDGLLEGMRRLARRFKVNIVGGDLSRAPGVTIDVSMVGEVEKKYLALRKGATQGDAVFVTGRLGGSFYGRHLTFMPRIEEARFLVKHFKVSAMIDISDGLLQDLSHILEESKVGALLYEKAIPVHRDARTPGEALSMGEDFELLFTVPRAQAPRLIASCGTCTLIGHIVDKKFGLQLIDRSCNRKTFSPKGFSHF